MTAGSNANMRVSRADALSWRVRGVLLATGVVSAVTFFPLFMWYFLDPVLLIASGMAQPRFPRPGRWLAWLGATGLSLVLVQEGIYVFGYPLPYSEYVHLPFPFPSLLLVTTALAVWCDAELIADGLRSIRASRLAPPVRPKPVGWWTWILAALANAWVGWGVVLAAAAYRRPGGLGVVLMDFVWLVAVAALDIGLVRRFAKTRRGGQL